MRPRDEYLDWLRATSLVVVVLWHWAFTILRWTPTGPVPTSPLGFWSGVWILTWLLQVLPMFFYVGGCVHSSSWARDRKQGVGHYVWRHVRHLLVPALLLVLTWVVLGAVSWAIFGLSWIRGVVLLVVSPLWFLGVYVVLIALVPVSSWLHRRFDVLVPVWLGGIAMVVDVLRFRYDLPWIGWVNMLVVWWLAHQAGFFHHRLTRRTGWALFFCGLFGLAGLVFSGLYPGSMVGVPGDRLSNIGPPTFVIVALLVFQIGFAVVTRPLVERVLDGTVARRVVAVVSSIALPLFLFHSTGMALARVSGFLLLGGQISDDRAPDLIWWLQRPLAVVVPLLFTLPVIVLFGLRRRT
ncbi:acyltransferase family protein [Lentzea aerocolonigenes]|uniref:acyltransferase family protein n=1 Tax=Lentzea aerocolonigenes TaxID=68170 RepID=UPI0004C467C2|nr:acyltransferase family protein [Lentzea aerocolonigenes]MCP2250445.1 Acyltransferase family protein [Lentzea aerocolonigenes]